MKHNRFMSQPWTPKREILKRGNKHANLLLALHQTSDSLAYPCTRPTFQLWPPCSPRSPPVSPDSSHIRLLRVSQTGPAVPYMRTFAFAIPSVQNTDPCPLPTPLTFKKSACVKAKPVPFSYASLTPSSTCAHTYTHTSCDLRHSSSLFTAIMLLQPLPYNGWFVLS